MQRQCCSAGRSHQQDKNDAVPLILDDLELTTVPISSAGL
jgi:hypothetical protein